MLMLNKTLNIGSQLTFNGIFFLVFESVTKIRFDFFVESSVDLQV